MNCVQKKSHSCGYRVSSNTCRQYFRSVVSAALLGLTTALLASSLHAQDTDGDPTGNAGDYSGLVTTAGAYDAFTGNAKRTVTDMVVPGSNGAYPLAFTRYANSRVTDVDKIFGECGTWRHSYAWTAVFASQSSGNSATVYYPDGRVTAFDMSQGKPQPAEIYARGPLGVNDRLDLSLTGGYLYLHMEDGGVVKFFSYQADPSSSSNGVTLTIYRACAIIDRYGATTTLSYSSTGHSAAYLTQVTEPGGRSINLHYSTANQSAVVLTSITACETSSSPLEVDYTYANPLTVGSTTYLPLSYVVYKNEPLQNGYNSASYTYISVNGGAPLLLTCDDPHYDGPMTRITYLYNTVNGIQGFVLGEHNFPNGNGPDYAVSSLAQSTSTVTNGGTSYKVTTSTDTRGDTTPSGNPYARTFTYGQPTTVSDRSGSPGTNAKAFLPTTVTDFEGNKTYLFYQTTASNAGRCNVRAIIHPNSYDTNTANEETDFVTEPYVGKVTKTTLSDSATLANCRTRQTVWQSMDGNTTTNGYKTDGTTPCGACTTPYYVFKQIDEHGLLTVYHRYTASGLVYQIDHADGKIESYTYQTFTGPGGNYYKVATYTNRLGAKLTYTYGSGNGGSGRSDLLTKLTRSYNGTSESTSFYYDSIDRLAKSVMPGMGSNTVSDEYAYYDGRHTLRYVEHDADQTYVNFTYDNYGRLIKTLDELNHATTTDYDDYGRPIKVTWPVNAYSPLVGNCSKISYYDRRDNSGNMISPALSHTSSQYSFTFMPSGRGEMRVYSGNNWMTDHYLGQGDRNAPNLTSKIHDMAGVGYDQMGRVLNYTDMQGHVWRRAYDSCGRMTSTVDPTSHETDYDFYKVGEKVVGGGSGNVDYAGWLKDVNTPPADTTFSRAYTTYDVYDANGNATSITAPFDTGGNRTLTKTYNTLGNLTAQSDGLNTTQYAYDQLGRRKQITYPDGTTTEKWTYHPGGMISTYTNRGGAVCTYSYDSRNRLSSRDWNPNTTFSVNYTLDAASRLTKVTNGTATVQYGLDDSGAASSETETITGAPFGFTTNYTRDIDGHITNIRYPVGENVGFSYDAEGRCLSTFQGATTYSQNRYSGDLLAGYWLNIGVQGNVSDTIYTSYRYQDNRRINQVDHYYSDSSGTLNGSTVHVSTRQYGYAPDGQISWTNHVNNASGGNALENGHGDSYLYWPDGSLNKFYRDYAIQGGWPNANSATLDAGVNPTNLVLNTNTTNYRNIYAYDAAGNRSSVTHTNRATDDYSPNANDQYNTYGGVTWNYDSFGDVRSYITSTGWTYSYDAEGKLMGGAAAGQSVLLRYDGLGRLVKQTINGTDTLIYYAGDQRIEERDSSNNPVCRYYYAAPGSDQILYRKNAGGARLWYLSDLTGNTTHVLDDSGNIVEQYEYDAYGMPTFYDGVGNILTGGSNYDTRYLFGGNSAYEWLPGPQIYFCRARCYDPIHGRWLQPDPIGQGGGLNIYAYCENDPINGVDPSGLEDLLAPPVIVSGDRGWEAPPSNLLPAHSTFLGYGEEIGGGRTVLVRDNNSGIEGEAPDPSAKGDDGVVNVRPLIYSPPSVTRGIVQAAASLYIGLIPIGPALLAAAGGGDSYGPITDGGFNRESVARNVVQYGPMVAGAAFGAAKFGLSTGAAVITEETGFIEGASSTYDTSITRPGSQYVNVQTNVTAQQFQSTLVSNGFDIQSSKPGVTILSNGQSVYTIYTRTSTGLPGAQYFGPSGSVKFSLGGQ